MVYEMKEELGPVAAPASSPAGEADRYRARGVAVGGCQPGDSDLREASACVVVSHPPMNRLIAFSD